MLYRELKILNVAITVIFIFILNFLLNLYSSKNVYDADFLTLSHKRIKLIKVGKLYPTMNNAMSTCQLHTNVYLATFV